MLNTSHRPLTLEVVTLVFALMSGLFSSLLTCIVYHNSDKGYLGLEFLWWYLLPSMLTCSFFYLAGDLLQQRLSDNSFDIRTGYASWRSARGSIL